eukprot:TRINITY_DN436_c0_g1_i4.p1 TRINITY_DN436_c0_g1~~TRINITY_DN436_c0_g1_i4.p1  ORF type:complete len:493 (-),score=123.38 TRINITY_DN436_c0_g1_i4:165-1643(-)
MICSISGTTPEEPVVSTKSGHVFEKRLIEKYVEVNGKDPITNEPISQSDLVEIKGTSKIGVKPRPPIATSIPSMLQIFQNEWDSIMLETYTLKQHLDTVRKELSHALYQHDAACRVIARLIKERDQARNALATASVQLPGGRGQSGEPMDTDIPTGISDEVKEKMQKKSAELSGERKRRTVPETLPTPEVVSTYSTISSNPIHKASTPGILCVDTHPFKQEFIVTGGVDSSVVLFNKDTSRIASTLTGHTKRITSVQFYPTPNELIVLSSSQDKTARVWREDGEGKLGASHVVRVHDDEVVGVSLHATGDYFVTASADKTWAFHDIHSGRCLMRVADPQVQAGFECVQFHPDGLILGTGTADSLVRVWDIKSQQNVATFEGHSGRVVDIAFSENGYYLATAGGEGIKIWDLRRLKNFYNIPLEGVNAVAWDYSGSYLAASGNDIRIFHGKSFTPVQTYLGHESTVTDIKFSRNADWFASTSMDRFLKIWGSA